MTEKTSDTSNEQFEAYVQVGEDLRKARIKASLEIGEVSRKLHLSGMIIEDIEQGRIERLSPLYRRGYISNYARLLGLDPALMMARLSYDEPPELREVLPVNHPGWKFDRYLKIATYLLVTTVIVPPLAYFFIEGGSRIMERDPAVVADQAPVVEQGVAQERQGRNRIARALSLEETDGSRDVGDAGHVSASALPLAAVRTARETSLHEQQSGDMLLPALELVENESEQPDSIVDLAIEVVEDSWVEIHDADGQRLEYDLLRAGQSRAYRGEAPFQLLLGRANAVRVSINDELITYEGHERGDVARFRLLAGGEVER